MAGSGAGALYVGPAGTARSWPSTCTCAARSSEDPVAAANSPEAQEFSRQSVHAWTAVVEASGTASAEEIAAATEVSMAQFAPDA